MVFLKKIKEIVQLLQKIRLFVMWMIHKDNIKMVEYFQIHQNIGEY